ncbi:MAG: hypothetical protein ACI81G_000298 [Gammaproteobacteria bacterium]|jgi:hypothetical protein
MKVINTIFIAGSIIALVMSMGQTGNGYYTSPDDVNAEYDLYEDVAFEEYEAEEEVTDGVSKQKY